VVNFDHERFSSPSYVLGRRLGEAAGKVSAPVSWA
jgi:hypothetical protein